MGEKPKLLGFYNYTVILTYLGMLIGFAGIICAFSGHPWYAMFCLMGSGLCDMYDGKVASTMKRTRQEKTFGIQIDSLSDLICFGVLPGMILAAYAQVNANIQIETVLSMIVAALYTLAALIRLAYFNVDEQERQLTSNESREIYYGLPVTMAALIVPAMFGIGQITTLPAVDVLMVTLAIMAVMFLLPFELKKPKSYGKLIFLGIGLIICIILIILH